MKALQHPFERHEKNATQFLNFLRGKNLNFKGYGPLNYSKIKKSFGLHFQISTVRLIPAAHPWKPHVYHSLVRR